MWTQKSPPASITNHLLLWMNVMFDFICIGFAMRNAKKATNSKWKWMSLAGIKPAWIKAIRCNIGIKWIMVRYILELTVRQNLHFFYQCRCNLLLFTELGMDTRNHNTYDKVLILTINRNSVKLLNIVYHLSVSVTGRSKAPVRKTIGCWFDSRWRRTFSLWIFRFLCVSHSSTKHIQMKSSITFIQSNRSLPLFCFLLRSIKIVRKGKKVANVMPINQIPLSFKIFPLKHKMFWKVKTLNLLYFSTAKYIFRKHQNSFYLKQIKKKNEFPEATKYYC